MAGHRRISTDLFLKYVNDASQFWKVGALLSLDQDNFRGGLLPVAAYARVWGKNRVTVRKLISEWEAHKMDCYHPNRGDTLVTGERQASDTHGDTQSPAITDTSVGPNDTQGDTKATGERHFGDTILEQEPEQERRSPPRKPSARGVGVASSRSRLAAEQVRLALGKSPPESVERRDERAERYRILSEMFLAAGQVADDARLRCYFRSTSSIPTAYLERACDEARAKTDGTWPPPEDKIVSAGRSVAAMQRKRARGRA